MKIDKFKYHQSPEQLWIKEEGKDWVEIKERSPSPYQGWYWTINPNDKSHWIQTLIRQDRIDIFYKLIIGKQFIYCKKQIPLQNHANYPTGYEFTFDYNDVIEKNKETGKWEWKLKPSKDKERKEKEKKTITK